MYVGTRLKLLDEVMTAPLDEVGVAAIAVDWIGYVPVCVPPAMAHTSFAPVAMLCHRRLSVDPPLNEVADVARKHGEGGEGLIA